MRRHLLVAVIGVAVLAAGQQPSTSSSTKLLYEDGVVANGIYSNECFGISLPAPPGWEISAPQSGAPGKALHLPGGQFELFGFSRRKSGSAIGVNLMAYEIKDAQARSAREYVSKTVHMQVDSSPQYRELIQDATEVDYGGKHFYRADYKQSLGDARVVYLSFVLTVFRGYLVGEFISSDTQAGLSEAADSLLKISFGDDQRNPNCVVGGENLPQGTMYGVIGGIVSSEPSVRPAKTAHPIRVLVSEKVSKALLIKKVQPQYPEEARRQRIQGLVVLRALIDTNGDVENLTPVSGDPLLVPVAVDAVRQWKYKPYLYAGQPVQMSTQVTVSFEQETK